MEISFINHASVIIRNKNVSLLIDPWFWGTCFEEGWGLRYNNPDAIEKVKSCTHLWVSHFHQDHFHRATLAKIIEVNPDIIFLGNRSYNFQLDEAAKSTGFKKVIPVFERKLLEVEKDFTIIRYPTTGIDNMLLIQAGNKVILNYNDCSLPDFSQKRFKKRFGHIDYLLTNFNHAGKLLLYPFPSPEVIRQKLVKSFSGNYSIFNPDYILPFASYHYYRSPESAKQNNAMLDVNDLLSLDKRIIDWHIGDKILLNDNPKPVTESVVEKNKIDQLIHKTNYPISQLKEDAAIFSRLLRKRFGIVSRFFPALNIEVSDLQEKFSFKPGKGFLTLKEGQQPHIIAHSESLHNWFSKQYGTDSFVVGAHFDIVNDNRIPLKWQLVTGILTDNKLDLRSFIKMLFKRDGIRFLWNRREEIVGILFSFRLAASYHED